MATYHSTYGVCTAYQIHNMGSSLQDQYYNKATQIRYLKTDETLLKCCKATDFALIWSINIESQRNDETFKKLGFTEAFFAPKTHEKCRHKGDGGLKMWCIQPWVLNENRLKLLDELENGDKKFKEEQEALRKVEVERRLTFSEFKLTTVRKSEAWIAYDDSKILMDDIFPATLEYKRVFFDLVKELTGGFDVGHDPVVIQNMRGLTWRTVKERALLYRSGSI